MPINFEQQKQELENTLSQNRQTDPTPPEVGQQIAVWYDEMIRTGQDSQFGNTVVSTNLPALTSSLQGALSSRDRQAFSNAINTGIISYWTGATLAQTTPPPGSIQVVNNVVNNPGNINYTLSSKNSSLSLFISELVNSIRSHLSTISGVTTSLTPQPSGPPVPVTYPFQGYI